MNKRLLQNLVVAIGLISLAVFIHISSRHMAPASVLFPRLMSWILGALSVWLIVQSLWQHQLSKRIPNKSAQQRETNVNLKQKVYPFVIVFLCILFLLVFRHIGFELSAFFLMFIIMVLIDRKQGLRKAYFALAVPAIFILIFKIGIKLRVPLLLERFY